MTAIKNGIEDATVIPENQQEVIVKDDIPQELISEAMSGFDEAELVEGVNIVARGLGKALPEPNDEKMFLIAKRGECFSEIHQGMVPAIFFFSKEREMFFTSSASIIGACSSLGTLEEEQCNYVRIKFLGKEKSADKKKDINRYEVRLCNPAPKAKQAALKQ